MSVHDSRESFGRYLEEFEKGMIIRHWPAKTLTSSECHLFSLLTMNHHPVHIDSEYAKRSQHGRPLVVGTYVFSLVVGQSVRDISGKAIANLGYENVVHHAPVFEGDTLRSESKVLGVVESRSKSDRGVVEVETEAFNQKDEKVLSFRRKVLVPKRS